MREGAHILRTVADLEELRSQVENSLSLLRSLAHQLGAYDAAQAPASKSSSVGLPAASSNDPLVEWRQPDAPKEPPSFTPTTVSRARPKTTPSTNRRWTDAFKTIFQERPDDWIGLTELRRCALQAGAGNLTNIRAILFAWKNRHIVTKRGKGANAEYKYLIRETNQKYQNENDQDIPRIVAL